MCDKYYYLFETKKNKIKIRKSKNIIFLNGLEEYALNKEDIKENLAFKCKSLVDFAKNNID